MDFHIYVATCSVFMNGYMFKNIVPIGNIHRNVEIRNRDRNRFLKINRHRTNYYLNHLMDVEYIP